MRDTQSFDEFYRGTSVRLLRFGYALVGDLTEAQDLVQETYTRAWQHWRTLPGHPNPEGWLRVVLSRLAGDRWRRMGRWQAVLGRTGPPEPVPPPDEDALLLVAALRRLPLNQRRALALHYLFDLPVADVAREIGVPEGTVKSWLSRGRAALVAILTGPPVQPGQWPSPRSGPPARPRTGAQTPSRAGTENNPQVLTEGNER